jgi:hypothetical protein
MFFTDLAFGNSYERRLVEMLKLTDYEIVKGCVKDYDIIDNGTRLTYEVKADRNTIKTGNICIEYECNGKPSGITTTRADYIAYFEVEGKLYIIPTIRIIECINKQQYHRRINCGDGYKSRCYLFDKTLFTEYITNGNV